MTIRTRFAPSPTGKMHIGSVRTALFCWLYAKHTGGEFLLRIEDTDKERSTPENTEVIINDLNWLGLTADNQPVMQSANEERHKQIVAELLSKGAAYEEEGAVRFKVPNPQDGITTWTDQIQGKIDYPHNSPSMKDFVIQRSDGTPTYNLAVVADDHDMGVTHVVRGDDHINNTPKQILIYQAMGWDVPTFAHMALIHGADGKKMSKRHGAVGVEDFRQAGYLPKALLTYLMRLGWSMGDEELIPLDAAIANFELTDINKGASVFDYKKLDWTNNQIMKQTENSKLLEYLAPFFAQKGLTPTDEQTTHLLKGLDELKTRAKRLDELADSADFYLKSAPFELDEKSITIMQEGGASRLSAMLPEFEALSDWTNDPIHAVIANHVETNELKFKEVGLPLRLAITGKAGGPSISSVMEILGKEESLHRLKTATKLS